MLGDSYGQVYMAGKQNIADTGGHELIALNNTFTQCGVGRAATSTMFYLIDDAGLTSSRFIIDGNHTDAVTKLHNPDGIDEVYAAYPPTRVTASRALVSDADGVTSASAVTGTQLGYLSGATSNIQDQLDNASGFSGTANRALQTDNAGATEVSGVTSTELGYLSGTSSSVQTQLGTKLGMSNNSVTITQGQGADTSIYLKRNGDTKQFSITRKSSYTKWKTIGGGKEHFLTHDDGRFDFKEGITRLAPISSQPSENAANAKGGFWYDSSASPGVLKWHDGVSWKTVSLT